MMSQHLSKQQVESALKAMSSADRCLMLTMSIVADHSHDPIGSVLAFADLMSRMTVYLNHEKRQRVAERLRSIADHVERADAGIFDGATS